YFCLENALPSSIQDFREGDISNRDVDFFPTRRSSDLERMGVRQCRRVVAAVDRRGGSPPDGARPARCQISVPAVARAQSALQGRSEEHTSELQSRENLVCRILLEKKKEILRTKVKTTC